MLILVAVTINMAINGGLFSYAGKAVGDMQNAIDRENELASGKIEIGGVQYDSIDDYLANRPSAVHSWTREGDTFTCSHCNATYTMGQVVDYEPTGKASTTVTVEKSGLNKYYIKNSSYPSNANMTENGDGTQIVNAQNANWIVLGIENTDKDEDDIYETLLITTQSPVYPATSKYLYFFGAEAYNNAVDEINRICKELYSNSTYGEARGMTIEDVNRALNYTPIGGYYYDGSNYQTTENLTTKLKDIPTWDNIKGNCQTPDGTDTETALGEYPLNGYWYYLNSEGTGLVNDVNDTTTTITTLERDTIFGSSGDYLYLLASRGVYAGSDYAVFGPGFVVSGCAYSCNGMFFSDGDEYIGSAGFRPVVSLRSTLPTVSGATVEDDTSSAPA